MWGFDNARLFVWKQKLNGQSLLLCYPYRTAIETCVSRCVLKSSHLKLDGWTLDSSYYQPIPFSIYFWFLFSMVHFIFNLYYLYFHLWNQKLSYIKATRNGFLSYGFQAGTYQYTAVEKAEGIIRNGSVCGGWRRPIYYQAPRGYSSSQIIIPIS